MVKLSLFEYLNIKNYRSFFVFHCCGVRWDSKEQNVIWSSLFKIDNEWVIDHFEDERWKKNDHSIHFLKLGSKSVLKNPPCSIESTKTAPKKNRPNPEKSTKPKLEKI
jgi:hypothetical protein